MIQQGHGTTCGYGRLTDTGEKVLGKKRGRHGDRKDDNELDRRKSGRTSIGCGVGDPWAYTSSECMEFVEVWFTRVKPNVSPPVRDAGGFLCTPLHLSSPRASRKPRQRAKLQTSPLQIFVADTKTMPVASPPGP
jgi:hypothetical protein